MNGTIDSLKATSVWIRLTMLVLLAVAPLLVQAAVDINKADVVTLAKELKGVGPAKAKAIVDYRTKNGAFKSIEDLGKVKGIGASLLEKNRANIIIDRTAATKAKTDG